MLLIKTTKFIYVQHVAYVKTCILQKNKFKFKLKLVQK